MNEREGGEREREGLASTRRACGYAGNGSLLEYGTGFTSLLPLTIILYIFYLGMANWQ